jgi:hypothetical protein
MRRVSWEEGYLYLAQFDSSRRDESLARVSRMAFRVFPVNGLEKMGELQFDLYFSCRVSERPKRRRACRPSKLGEGSGHDGGS